MAKTNFNKVEDAFDQGLRRLTVQHLLTLTEKGKKNEDTTREQVALIILLEAERLYRKDNKIYKKLGIKNKDLKIKLEKVQEVEVEDWKKILKLKEKLSGLAKEIDTQFPDATDEELVESERHKHINKRFNTNEGWLPLK